MIRVTGVRVPVYQRNNIKRELSTKLRISESDLLSYQIFKESIDARRKGMINFVYTVDVKVRDESIVLERNAKSVQVSPNLVYKYPERGAAKLNHRPVIVGAGPCGLMAGLLLAEMGYCPLLLERGASVDERAREVDQFWKTGRLNEQINVQFGEGGAGAFSDGKLTTNIKDKRCRKALSYLVEHGAPDDILYSYRPHVGTDKLRGVVKSMRNRIIEQGGEVRFNAHMTDIAVKNGQVTGVEVNGTDMVPCDVVLLAIGHSARDTFVLLYYKEAKMVAKPFSIGARIEHLQDMIDRAQYGKFAGHPNLGAADYRLKYHSSSGRSAYTFCMCPGGYVVAAASEAGRVVTNGMSYHARDGRNANAAVLVGVNPGDFASEHPLAGIEFQRQWESKAFERGGKSYSAPAQLVGDFLKDKASTASAGVIPTYTPGVAFTNLSHCLPKFVVETMREAIIHWGTKIKGYSNPEAVLTGVETRSSSPVRILRDEEYQSSIKGLYPAGEGAGYAGGIVSAGVDGIRVAETIIRKFARIN